MAAPSKTLTASEFSSQLERLGDFSSCADLAVAVSGGGDSMALAWLLAQWCKRHKVQLHVLTVNHGLRPEAAAEAKLVKQQVESWGASHKTLRWVGQKPGTRLQEEARTARYKLLTSYCHKHKIAYLFVAHHANDQMETVLFRLTKGSGLDGLGGMAPLQEHESGVTLVRPLLEMTHTQLLQVCKKAKISWVEDKSNVADRYARVRLRKSLEIFEAEGLTLKRILATAARLERAGKVLDQLTEKEEKNLVVEKDTKRLVYNVNGLSTLPEEIVIRILTKSIQSVSGKRRYPPSLERVEEIAAKICAGRGAFKAATLGGCLIQAKWGQGILSIQAETGASSAQTKG